MKRNVKFNKDRRLSRGSLNDMDGSSPIEKSKSPVRNGNPTRPQVDRTDTGASGWATENDSDDQVYCTPNLHAIANAMS